MADMTLDCLPSDFDLNPKTQAKNFLFSAGEMNCPVAIKALVDCGADINIVLRPEYPKLKDQSLVTPFSYGVRYRSDPLIHCLLDNGVDVPHISQWQKDIKENAYYVV
jgi:hypothetical protein